MDKIPMTRPGLLRLEDELKSRKNVERPRIVEAIAEARAHGDLSENAEYHAAREQQSFNEGRIKELEGVIGSADVIDISKFTGDKQVRFGATVLVADEETDEERKFQIVGEYESNADEGRISMTSPIARALIGKKEGDSVTVKSPKGAVDYEVVEVSYE